MKWNYYSLDTVARLVSGRTPEREQKAYYARAGTPWVKIENLNQGYITETAEYLSDQGREKVNLVPKNSVLFSIVGTVGKVGIAGRELATNQQIVSLIFDETKVLPLFGYYCLRYHADEIRKLSNQTTMALISRKTLGQYRICVPESLKEQEEIVEKLRKFEDYGKKKVKLREQFGRYETLLFKKIFHGEIQYHERLMLREFLQEGVTSGVPKSEEPEGGFSRIESREFERPYLREISGTEEAKDPQKRRYLPDEKYQVREGDILLRNGSLILVQEQTVPRFIDRSVLRIRTKAAQLLPEVLYGYLSLSDIRSSLYGERKAGDSRKRPIRGSELERLKIPYFTMEKQEEYRGCLRKIRSIQKSLDREIVYAWKTFRVMLYRLMNEPEEKYDSKPKEAEETQPFQEQESERELPASRHLGEEAVCHLILAVLAGWHPSDGNTGEYCRKRQQIFRRAQPYFQPVALSFVTEHGQKEYLLERDFLTYHSAALSEQWEEPLAFLQKLLRQWENGEIRDAHLAFQGENGICTEADWSGEAVTDMAREGMLLLAGYSGFGACEFLFALKKDKASGELPGRI